MDHPDNATVRSAVGFVGNACWFIGGGNCWHRYPGRRVREAVRDNHCMDRNYPSPNDILVNRQRAKDRATYLGAIDHLDNTTVRSAVGFVGDACWLIEGG
jgi:hypothetical protein